MSPRTWATWDEPQEGQSRRVAFRRGTATARRSWISPRMLAGIALPPVGPRPFRPSDSATAEPIRSATPSYQSGHGARLARRGPARTCTWGARPKRYTPQGPEGLKPTAEEWPKTAGPIGRPSRVTAGVAAGAERPSPGVRRRERGCGARNGTGPAPARTRASYGRGPPPAPRAGSRDRADRSSPHLGGRETPSPVLLGDMTPGQAEYGRNGPGRRKSRPLRDGILITDL